MSNRELIRYVVKGVALAILILTGIAITDIPDDEVMYTTTRVINTLEQGQCLAHYDVKVGNTGANTQQHVEVSFKNKDVQNAFMPVRVLSSGGAQRRDIEIESRHDLTTYRVSNLLNGRWVNFRFSTKDICDKLADPDEIVAEVAPTEGEVLHGDPLITRFGRILILVSGLAL